MANCLLCLVVWVVVSVPVACLVGLFIRVGRGWEIEEASEGHGRTYDY